MVASRGRQVNKSRIAGKVDLYDLADLLLFWGVLSVNNDGVMRMQTFLMFNFEPIIFDKMHYL